ncbi:MAG: hypothetical protein CG441_1301 [Methylococcaceae bacterium NSM2-1]|jgi:hypothetical protein|nr:MAG: hypothetical protein CG441_1301 [Methylococcaceae bacterium NSM2-1]
MDFVTHYRDMKTIQCVSWIFYLVLETPMPFVLSSSATLRRVLAKDEFAEILVCLFLTCKI